MPFKLLPLLLASLLTGCASYTADYQERLIRSLPNQREVTFNETRTYPGNILCGRYTTLTADGFNMRTSDFVVGEAMVLSSPSDTEMQVYCSKDPAGSLHEKLGIGPSDNDWSPLIKLRDDMLAIDTAVTRYYNHKHTLPRTLEALLEGDYGVRSDNLVDPWARPYHYEGGLSGRTAPQYQLGSLGADAAQGGVNENADINHRLAPLLDYVLRISGH